MVNLFYPYYQCGDKERQKEIDLCLKENINNKDITRLVVLIDDNSVLPFTDSKIDVIYLETRPTYKKWIELTKEMLLTGVTVLCNSDIYFDHTVNLLNSLVEEPLKFVALSRWEIIQENTSLHSNPHWSQDVWAMNCNNSLSKEMLHQLDFPMGVPRCDNKIAYLFGISGWEVFNPCEKIKSFHVHETEMRTYHKKLDSRIIGCVAYVHPAESYNQPSSLEFDVWVRASKNIKSVKINKSLERWFDEAAIREVETRNTGNRSEFLTADNHLLLIAMKNGESVRRNGPNFEMLKNDGELIFKNAYNLKNIVKFNPNVANKYDEDILFALGVIPPVLDSFAFEIMTKAQDKSDLKFWQYPCATEKQAYENHLSMVHGEHIDLELNTINIYVPLPWATYIDRKNFPKVYLQKITTLLKHYKSMALQAGLTLKVHSVCQHIHWIRILDAAKDLGITNLHLSHKDSKSEKKQIELGYYFSLHGWPLIAVNYVTPDRKEGMERKPVKEKKLLASFIGAHMPHYIDDSRLRIFEAARLSGRDDVLVDLGNEWHFNKVVYEEQVLSKEITSQHIDENHKKTFRYNTILSDSIFSLCPIGAGPNTLRLWESIAVGSIPVVFSNDLAVFKDSDIGSELLENIIIWNSKLDNSLFDFLSNIDEADLEVKSINLLKIYQLFEKKTLKNNLEMKIDLVSENLNETNIIKKEKVLKILYVGASVTAQKNGYRPSLNRLFNEAGYDVQEKIIATGATGSLFGLCNLSVLPNNESYDLAIYEYSTGDLNIGLTPLDLIAETVNKSLILLKSISQNVLVLNNYRSDFENGKGDFIRTHYQQAAKKQNVGLLDLYITFEKFKLETPSDWDAYYRDSVHTNELGSKTIAHEVFSFFGKSGINKGSSEPMKSGSIDLALYPKIIPFPECGLDKLSYVYPASKQIFNYISFNKNKVIRFKMKGQMLGLISIIGPKSGWIRIECKGKKILEFCLFDQHCHYTRVQPRAISYTLDRFEECSMILVDNPVKIEKCDKHHEHHHSEREVSIAGFMGMGLIIKDVVVEKIANANTY